MGIFTKATKALPDQPTLDQQYHIADERFSAEAEVAYRAKRDALYRGTALRQERVDAARTQAKTSASLDKLERAD